MNKSSKSMVPMVVVGVLLLAIGAAAGYFGAAGKCGATGGDKGYQAGWEAARQKVSEARIFPQMPAIMSVSGTVVSVSGDELVMDAAQVIMNPLEPQAPTRRTVKVTSATKITEQTAKSAEQLQKDQEKFNEEMAKFNTDMQAGKSVLTPPTPPSPYETKEIALKDIAAGTSVSVTAATDITMAEKFDATVIAVTLGGSAAAAPAVLPGGPGAVTLPAPIVTPPVPAPAPAPLAP